MISYVKFGNSFVGGKKKLDSPDDFFGDFDNDDLEALLDESFDVDNTETVTKAAAASESTPGDVSFLGQDLEIENNKIKSAPMSKREKFITGKG